MNQTLRDEITASIALAEMGHPPNDFNLASAAWLHVRHINRGGGNFEKAEHVLWSFIEHHPERSKLVRKEGRSDE